MVTEVSVEQAKKATLLMIDTVLGQNQPKNKNTTKYEKAIN